MTNKLIKRRYNNLLTVRNNYFDNGGGLFANPFKGAGGTSAASSLISGAASAVGKIGGGLIGGGMSSGAGSVFSGLSSVASAIPGPWGAVASAGLGILGGITDRLFGSKLNEENIAEVESNINSLNSFKSNASDYDTLTSNWANANTGMTFDDSFIGKDGVFAHKAKDKAASLREQVNAGNNWVQNTLTNNAENIGNTQMQNLLANYAAFGGDLMTHGANFDTGITLVGNGGTHEENPNEGVPMGVDSEGIPNLVEEGEVIFNDYVFSNRLKVPKAVRKKYKLRGTKPLTFADAAIQMSKESEERPNDPISQAGLEDSMLKLMLAQEQIRAKEENNKFAKGGKLGRVYAGEEGDPYSQILDLGRGPLNPSDSWALTTPEDKQNKLGIVLGGYTSNPTIIKPGESTIPGIIETQKAKYPSVPTLSDTEDLDTENSSTMAPTWMRYIPAYASGAMAVTDALGLTNKPSYGEAEAVLGAAKNAGVYNPISFSPIGNYLTYKPFDRDYYINKLNAESSATRRAILNNSGGNRAQALAGILAADYNAQSKMGDLFRQAEEYNLAQRQKVEEFNRATNMFNSEGAFKADQANQSAQMNAKSSYLKGALTAAELRQRERQTSTASRSANLSNFINSLGDIGRENFSRNMIISDPSKYYTVGDNGEVSYKDSFYDLSEAEQDYIIGHASRKSKRKKARGGYLTIRRK